MAHFFDDPIIFVGFLISIGISLSFVFQRVGTPHIVVYISVGFLLSNTLFSNIDLDDQYGELFEIVEIVALGLIGFKIGTELKFPDLMKQTKTIVVILIGNAGGAMVLVGILVFIFTPDYSMRDRILLSLILGGVATATAPAATVEIIRKYKSKGALTTLIMAVLALDDVAAVVIVEIVLVYVKVSVGDGFAVTAFITGLWQELGYALLLGGVVGVIMDTIVERMHDDLEMMELTLGVLLFTIGIAHFVHTSSILTCMMLGITVTNRKGDNYEKAGDLLEVIMSPIVTLFFVLVGAKVSFSDFNPFPILAIIYFVARLLGKYFGSYYGAAAIGADPAVKQNFGLGMFAQGGVALGLASVINETLIEGGEEALGTLVVSIIIIATVFSETLGTITAKYALTRAGDISPTAVAVSEVEDHTRTVHTRE